MAPADTHDLHARLSVTEDRVETLIPKVDKLLDAVTRIEVSLASKTAEKKRHPLALSAKELMQLGILLGALLGGVLWARPRHSELQQLVHEGVTEAFAGSK